MRIVLLVCIFLGTSFIIKAQPGDPGGNPTVPISGIELLVSAGVIFGIKKLLGRGKHK